MTVTAGFPLLVMRSLVTVLTVICDGRWGRIVIGGDMGCFGEVMAEFLDKMGAVTQCVGGKQKKEKKYRADMSLAGS